MQALADYFQLKSRGTTVATELRGAVATFLTMAYILFVNPSILSKAGVPLEPCIAATALAAGICCILMGVCSNFPLALASGMGINAVVAFTITVATGSWRTAMGVVVLDGAIVLLLVLTGLREAILDAIPLDLRRAIGAGIGLFIAFIGLVNAKLVLPSAAGQPLSPGSVHAPEAMVALLGLIITAVLLVRRVNGAYLIGIAICTAVALPLGVTKLPDFSRLQPPQFDILFRADVVGALQWRYMPMLFALIMVDFFDTLGTATAISEQAGLTDARGRIPGIRSLLAIDSLSAVIGGLFGVSSVTAYIESAAGVAEGARTGLHSVFVGLMFLAAIVLAPVAGVVPTAATAPALILIGFLMITHMGAVDFSDYETAIPAFVTLIVIPLTYSIAHGVGYGFILYTLIKLLSGKAREVRPMMYATAAAFAAYFVWGTSYG